MVSPYRDSRAALLERLRHTRSRVVAIEGTLTPIFWSEVAPGRGITPPRETDPPLGDSMDALHEAVAVELGRLSILEQAVKEIDRIEGDLRTPAEVVPRCQPRREVSEAEEEALSDSSGLDLENLRAALAETTSDAVFDDASSMAVRVSANIEGLPVEMLYDSVARWNSKRPSTRITMQTTVSQLSGELVVTPQGLKDDLLGAFGLHDEVVLDQGSFDGIFVIRAEEAVARILLTDEVRAALLSLSREDVPTLEVGEGLARISWSYEPNARCLRVGARALGALRAAPPAKSLRRV